MAWKAVAAALALALAATFAASADAKKKPKHKAGPTGPAYVNCGKLMPAAAADAATGGTLDLTSVTVSGYPKGPSWSSDCTYHSGTLSDPPAGAIGFNLIPSSAMSKKAYARALASYTKAAAQNATRPECQPDWDAQKEGFGPEADECQLLHPLGANSFELTGYLWILTPKYLVTVARGGHGDAATVQALGKAVLVKLH